MERWKLLLLAAMTIAGAVVAAQAEAREYAAQRNLNHIVLTLLRIAAASLAIRLMGRPENPWVFCMSMIYMAGIFGPIHRTTLNLVRINTYKVRIPWYHLGTQSKLDSLARTLWMGNEKLAFLSMCILETIIAGAMYSQLTP
jgi:hypothetical protein